MRFKLDECVDVRLTGLLEAAGTKKQFGTDKGKGYWGKENLYLSSFKLFMFMVKLSLVLIRRPVRRSHASL